MHGIDYAHYYRKYILHVKVKGKGPSTWYSAAYMRRLEPQHFTILLVVADWHELVVCTCCCVLASLFSIFFTMMLIVAFKDCDLGIGAQFWTDGNNFDVRRLQATTKVHTAIIRDLLFADDCALVVHTLHEVHLIFDRFLNTAWRFGLKVSLKKTEALHQSCPPSKSASALVTAGSNQLSSVDKFCYLGSFLSNMVAVDEDITSRLTKAGCFLANYRIVYGKFTASHWVQRL